ncbi:MAG: hypothetical protein MZV65_34445 [Chromatiales bacterium]|nr:hypothetical protein [Chromatiales bacterium]
MSGARGILVNVTAGRDLSIGEFEEVGNTVKEFAAEDATVVDRHRDRPGDASGTLRVTVVATGLGGAGEARKQPYKVVKTGTGHRLRGAGHPDGDPPQAALDGGGPARRDGGMEYLDIPAFLRRQAD